MPQNRKIIIPRIGDVVKSKQGRDRFRTFLIIDIDEKNKLAPVVVADGQLHKIGDKKHKNPRHLALVAHAENFETTENGGIGELHIKTKINALTDVQVYEICKKHDFYTKNT